MMRMGKLVATVFCLAFALAGAAEQRVSLLPKLRPGQMLTYLVRFQSEKNVKTESNVAVPLAPQAAQMDAHGLLRIEILSVEQPAGRPVIHAKARFLALHSGAGQKHPGEQKPNWDIQRDDPAGKTIEFTISSRGSFEEISGLETLIADEQQAWQEWAARFAAAWTLPSSGRDDSCAVLLTRAKLTQKSSPKDATPEDFKLHELKTMGTAKGTNEIITYISLSTGLVIRATEEANQQMDVVVAKADGSNRVHYNVDARSRSEVLLITETPWTSP